MKLNTSPVTSSQPPHSSSPARVRSVRNRRRVATSPATSRISAAGSNQATWPPISELTIRPQPVAPQPPVPPPPTLPVSSPVSRPSPL